MPGEITGMDARTQLLTLSLIPGMGPVRIRRLLEFFATPELILSAPVSLLKEVPGIGDELAGQISGWRRTTDADRELELADKAGARITTIFDDDYPVPLRTLYDPPLILYSRGSWSEQDERSIAVIGSRQASHYGLNNAKRFASSLAEAGVTVISGLARGVDTAAHEGALFGGGRTIAVIGSGLNQLYPPENKDLARRIEERGAVVSEFSMNSQPSRTSFPLRNRIVSGWSRGVLVSEAPGRSGSLITAQLAADQGRRVFAIPGPIDRPHSQGCHELIRNGATLVTSPREILEEFEWLPLEGGLTPSLFEIPGQLKSRLELTDSVEKKIRDAILAGTDTIDALCTGTGLPAPEVTRTLTRLQIRKIVEPMPGGRFRVK